MTLVFNKCCGCIDLKTGSFIIGYLNLIGNIIIITLNFIIIVESKDESSNSITWTTSEQQVFHIIFVVACVMMILLAVSLVFSIFLVVGLHQEKRGPVKAYLIYATILIVLYVIQFLAFLILLPLTLLRIADIIGILLNTYFLLCIRSYYIRMGESTVRQVVYKIT